MACILDYVSLWFVLQRGELRVAIRSCFDPQGIDSARVVTSGKNDCRFVVEGRTGQFAIHLQVLKEEREILHYKTELTPHRTVQMVVSARDLVFGGTGKNEDVEGKSSLHAERACFCDRIRLFSRSERRHPALLSESHFPE